MAKVATVLLNAATHLQDENGHIRWPLAELMRYLNDGLLELLRLQPQGFAQTQLAQLAAGTRQSVQGVYAVLNVRFNVDPATDAPRRAVRQVSLKHLDNFNPEWHTDTATAEVNNYARDPYDLQRFWVHPPNDGTGKVEVEVAIAPETVKIADGADDTLLASYQIDLPVRDIFAPALTYYVLHRAWAKDADFASNQQNSNKYYELFLSAAGGEG